MKKVYISIVFSSLILLTACGGGETNTETNKVQTNPETANCLDFAITEKYQSLDPIKVTDVASFHIVSQIFEPLLRFDDQTLSLQPLLAESWISSEDNLTHTFKIKKGVFFHDNDCFEGGKGREIKASDVVYSFKRIYSDKTADYAYSLFKNKIVGGEDFRNNGGEIKGLKAINDYTIEISLTKPSSNFLGLLATVATAVVAKEAIEKNAIVGSGPFTYKKENDTDKAVRLEKNNNYYLRDNKDVKLPYLDAVAYNYVRSGQEKLDLFMDNKLDVITDLPSESIKEIVATQISDFQDKPVKYILERHPQLSTSFLSFNTSVAPFDNIKVRKAIGMAINKKRIVEDVLKGEAFAPGEHGIVPPALKNYDYSSIIGLEYDLKKAKQLLSDAGFPNGKDFPTILFTTSKGNSSVRVGLEIQKQLLANLNINVEISSVPLAEKTAMNNSSKAGMSLNGWLGEFPDPVSFLSLFYGANLPTNNTEDAYPNESRFKNAEFDKLYEEALITIDDSKRYELCLMADQIIASNAPIVPLWYHENYLLIQSSIKNYHSNVLNTQYLTYVKIEAPVVEAKK
jgi:peptide/nickel transport system substrate-binding protein